MVYSIANAAPRNIESVRSEDIIPPSIQSSAQNLISLLEHYYEYLNTEGLPSAEISSISTVKDIDRKSLKYLTQIEELIAKNIPNASTMSRIELYKIIIRYYSTRGSEDSIHSFFKLFFNRLVEIIYPKELLFKLSEGEGAWSRPYDFLRDISDVKPLVLGGISLTPKINDGLGQFISIAYKDISEATTGIVPTETFLVENENGMITMSISDTARLSVVGTPMVFNDGTTHQIPSNFYFNGNSFVDGLPMYSTNFSLGGHSSSRSSLSRQNGSWIMNVRPQMGGSILAVFVSNNSAPTPNLVTSWTRTFVKAGLISGGVINSVTGVPPVNAQILHRLKKVQSITDLLDISSNPANTLWNEPIVFEENRLYCSRNNLPTTGVNVGDVCMVTGQITRPGVFGIAITHGNNIVWVKSDIVDEWVYANNKSFPSDKYKIFDGVYWQDYSYAIRSNLDSSQWYNDYVKFVHPAGLKLFSAIIIEIVFNNKWDNALFYNTTDVDNDDAWLNALIPPHNINPLSTGYHTPKFQPGYLISKLSRYLFTHLFDYPEATPLLQELILNYSYWFGPCNVQGQYVRSRWLSTEKFIDPCEIGAGLLNIVVADAIEPFSAANKEKFSNISSFIKIT